MQTSKRLTWPQKGLPKELEAYMEKIVIVEQLGDSIDQLESPKNCKAQLTLQLHFIALCS